MSTQISVGTVLMIVALHFLGDFVLQTRKIADRKHNSPKALAIHCLLYSLVLCIISPIYATVNGLLHYEVDKYTSLMTKSASSKKNYYQFFTIIGADQAIHVMTLILTYGWLQYYF